MQDVSASPSSSTMRVSFLRPPQPCGPVSQLNLFSFRYVFISSMRTGYYSVIEKKDCDKTETQTFHDQISPTQVDKARRQERRGLRLLPYTEQPGHSHLSVPLQLVRCYTPWFLKNLLVLSIQRFCDGWKQWLTPVIPTIWEAKTEGLIEAMSLRPAWAAQQDRISTKNKLF